MKPIKSFVLARLVRNRRGHLGAWIVEVAAPTAAEARGGRNAAIIGGVAAAAIIGGAIAANSQPRYYAPAPGYVA